jgi:hypothetical protein
METDITRPAQPPHVPQYGNAGRPGPRRSWMRVAAVAVVVVVLGLGCLVAMRHHKPFNENKNINSSEYQALFLTNGQVYFGKLADLNHKYITIHDIYYLQVQQGQSTTDGKSLQNASGSTDTNAQVSLAKLGSELHGPEDKMYISSDQVLFWENLTNNGKVAQAISAYQKTK